MIPEEAKNINTPAGFDTEFWRQLAQHKTHQAAYEATEEIHSMYWGRKKYSNFESYRISRDKRIRKK